MVPGTYLELDVLASCARVAETVYCEADFFTGGDLIDLNLGVVLISTHAFDSLVRLTTISEILGVIEHVARSQLRHLHSLRQIHSYVALLRDRMLKLKSKPVSRVTRISLRIRTLNGSDSLRQPGRQSDDMINLPLVNQILALVKD